MITLELTVVAIHGEGDQDTVNKLQDHRNGVGMTFPPPAPANEPPDVVIVLRDEGHDVRMELIAKTWQEVDQWKKLAGYDSEKRHWKTGGKIKVKIGG